MANTTSKESGQLEFVIKVYPDGQFSNFLDTKVEVGDRLDLVGPFGVFTLRDARLRHRLRRGRCRDGADPVPCCGRWPRSGSTRKATYYYGARTKRDLCFEEELHALAESAAELHASSRRSPRPTTTRPGTARSG